MLIFKYILYLTVLVFVAGCQQKAWVYQESISDYPRFSSALLRHPTKNVFNGIELQFLKGEFGTTGFLNVLSQKIPSADFHLTIGDSHYQFTGIIMEGGQRLLLPKIATEIIFRALLSGQAVIVYLEGFFTTLSPENFSKKYARFVKTFCSF